MLGGIAVSAYAFAAFNELVQWHEEIQQDTLHSAQLTPMESQQVRQRVDDYNHRISVFPMSLIARWGGLTSVSIPPRAALAATGHSQEKL